MKIEQAMVYARNYTLGAVEPLTNQGQAFDALRREVLKLRKDKARLDFMLQWPKHVNEASPNSYVTRAEVDAAMRRQKGGK